MPGPGSAIAIGSIRIPTVVVGFSVSLAAHAGLIATVALVPSGRGPASRSSGQPLVVPPTIEFALGEPIRVRLVSEDDVAPSAPDEHSDRAATSPEARDASPRIAPAVPADAASPRELEEVMTGALTRDPASAPGPAIDWAALVKSLELIDWSSFIASSHPAPADGAPDQSVTVQGAEPRGEPAPQPAAADDGARADPAVSPDASGRAARDTASSDTTQGVDRSASIIDLPQPVYPRRSRRSGHEGTAVVEVTVRADGSVSRIRLRTGSGHKLLDDAALKAARNGRFGPALRNGHPVDAIVIVPFEFKLTTRR